MTNKISVILGFILAIGLMVISSMDVPYFFQQAYLILYVVGINIIVIEYLHRYKKHKKSF
jgi:membrane protein YdbS with pleckstrin-like domain